MKELLQNLSVDYQYLVLLVSVLLIPKILLRFRVPTGITAMGLGALVANFLGWFQDDQLLLVLASLGITSLFLFAGMEIELDEIKQNKRPLAGHVLKSVAWVIITAFALIFILQVSFQVSLIISVALHTPSAGFILSSLNSYEMTEQEVYWVKLKAISKELIAVLILLIALQLDNPIVLFKNLGIFVAAGIILPQIFKAFLKFIAPYAPKSEVSFLVIIAFTMGVITKKLGTHYLVGAFLTGLVAGQFNHFIKSDESERILDSLGAFFYIFVPFYFFKAGLIMTEELFVLKGLLLGLAFCATIIPLRVGGTLVSVKYFIKDFWDDRFKISLSLLPNLIFGLVVVGTLKETFNVEPYILTGIIVFTLIASILPTLVFEKSAPEDYDFTRHKAKKKIS